MGGHRRSGPCCALVREIERVVIVERRVDVRIVRQVQGGERIHVGIIAPADDHRALRIALADRRQRRSQRRHEIGIGQRIVRLVLDLEPQPIGTVREILRHLPPDRRQLFRVGCGILMQLDEIVAVEDHVEIRGQRRVHHLADARHPCRVDREIGLRSGLVRPAHRNAHRPEPRGPDAGEVIRAQPDAAPGVLGLRLQMVAHVDARPHRQRIGMGQGGRTGHGNRCQRQAEQAHHSASTRAQTSARGRPGCMEVSWAVISSCRGASVLQRAHSGRFVATPATPFGSPETASAAQ